MQTSRPELDVDMKRARFSEASSSAHSNAEPAAQVEDSKVRGGEAFLQYLVGMWKLGELSAKTLTTICHHAAAAGKCKQKCLGVNLAAIVAVVVVVVVVAVGVVVVVVLRVRAL